MSIYSTVTAHSSQARQPEVTEIPYEDPLLNLNALTEKGSTMAGPAVSHEDSLAEYFSDDEEREKALKAQKDKKEFSKLERDT